MIMLGENMTAILLTPHCNTADNSAVVVGLGSVRREADVERRKEGGWGRAEAIINN